MKITRTLSFFIISVCVFLYSNMPVFSAADEGIKAELLSRGVIVRVWSGALHGGENVGHVSLETSLPAPTNYVSLWPADGENGVFVPSLAQDLVNEEDRNPESTIFLAHPSEAAPEGLRADIEFLHWMLNNDHLRWALAGEGHQFKPKVFFTEAGYQRCQELPLEDKALFGVYDVWAFNCASVVLNLLRNNGYLEQVNRRGSFPLNVTVTPDHAASLCAKQFLHNTTEVNDSYTVFRVFEHILRDHSIRNGRETPAFLSHHLPLFGQYWYKSHGVRVEENQNLLGEVDGIVRADQNADFFTSLARGLDRVGIASLLAPLVTGQGGIDKDK